MSEVFSNRFGTIFDGVIAVVLFIAGTFCMARRMDELSLFMMWMGLMYAFTCGVSAARWRLESEDRYKSDD